MKAKTKSPDGIMKAALGAIAGLHINQISPVEALTKLYELEASNGTALELIRVKRRKSPIGRQ